MLARIILGKLKRAASIYVLGFLGLILITGFILVLTQQIDAAGNTYYVAKNGSNSNPGTTVQPWLTIQYAANKVVAGDTVYVRAGTYNEQVFISRKSGTSSAWITFKTYPGERVVIDGTGLTLTIPKSLVEIYQCDYIDFEGFEICNTEKSGIGTGLYVTNDDVAHQGYILKNLTIHHCYGTGMLLAQYLGGTPTTRMGNITVDNCVIHDVNTGADYEETYSNPAISCTAIRDSEIKNCTIYNIGMQYATWTGQEGIVVRTGSANVSIHDNEIYQTRCGVYLQSQAIAMNNISIYNNKLHNNFAWGITLGSEGSIPYAMTNVNIYNNLIYSNATIYGHSGSSAFLYGNGGFGIMTYSFNKTFTFINNTLYNNGTKEEIAILDPGQYQQDCVVRNNLIVGQGSTNYIRYADYPAGVTIDHNLFYNTTYGTKTYTPDAGIIRFGTDYVITAPLLVNPDTDFSLQSGSPAIDAGSPSLAPITDYVGNSRPQGIGFVVIKIIQGEPLANIMKYHLEIDIGAYENDLTPLNDIN